MAETYTGFITLASVSDGTDGAPGTDGSQIWTTTTAPTAPNYTFNISNLTGDTSASPKIGDIIVYSYYRYTISSVSTSTVLAGTITSIRGSTGAAGYSSAEISLYQRSTSVLSAPAGGQTYTFSTGALSAIPVGWSTTVPTSDGNPCYVTTAFVRSNSKTGTVASWSTPTILVQDGESGDTIRIEVNPEQIFKFFEEGGVLTTSNSNFSFSVYRLVEDESVALVPGTDYNYKIRLSDLTDSNFSDLATFFQNVKVNTDAATNVQLSSLVFSTTGANVQVNLVESYKYNINSETAAAYSTSYNNYNQLVSSENFSYIIDIYDTTNTNKLSYKAVSFNFGTSQDMAKFALTSASIQAAVNNSKLLFNGDGLTIDNGGLRVVNGNNTLLEYDQNSQQLRIVGSGTFTGEINATSGSFEGEVVANELTANQGSIGGFILTNEGLFSAQPSGDTSNAKLQLYGKSGKVVANEIELGIGATIAQYIKLGKATLYNPESGDANGRLIEAGSTILNQNGVLTLGGKTLEDGVNFGGITLDGVNSKIFGGEDNLNNFEITPTQATFNNITARGKISTAVFETAKTQAVGGSMYFKPSYKVESTSGNVLTLNESWAGGNDYVYIVNQAGKVTGPYKLSGFTKNVITLLTTASDSYQAYDPISVNPFSVVDIGGDEAIIIGINTNGTNAKLYGRGITIDEFNNTGRPKVFLGDLDSLGANLRGYGLYSTNVFLNGSLTTVTGGSDIRYAGVNTLNGVRASKFENESNNDTSPIVFWGGSEKTDDASIQSAPFQVTQNGSLYAAQGLFEGAIITRSEIRGADIYAARIHGSGESPNPGLSFYDTKKGIVFYEGDYSDTGSDTIVETFTIGKEGLSTHGKDFISIDNTYRVNATFSNIRTTAGLQITDYKIFNSANNQFYIEARSSNEIGFYYINNNNTTQSISLEAGRINLNHAQTYVRNNLNLNDKMQYENTANGYDLYVY